MDAGFLREDWLAVKQALAGSRQKIVFAAVLAASLAAYAVLTNVFVLQLWEVNSQLDYFNAALVAAIAALTALLAAMLYYRRASLGHSPEKKGLLGSFVGAFATACPVCQPVWLAWLGLGSQTLFLVEASPYVATASIALLALSVHVAAQAIRSKTCAIEARTAESASESAAPAGGKASETGGKTISFA